MPVSAVDHRVCTGLYNCRSVCLPLKTLTVKHQPLPLGKHVTEYRAYQECILPVLLVSLSPLANLLAVVMILFEILFQFEVSDPGLNVSPLPATGLSDIDTSWITNEMFTNALCVPLILRMVAGHERFTVPGIVNQQSKCVSPLLTLLTGIVISLLLMKSGDVESNPGPTFLNVDDHLMPIKEAIWDARSQWRDIGRKLGLREGDINSIHEHSDGECLHKVLAVWIHSGEATTSVLLKALESKIVDRIDIVRQIRALKPKDKAKLCLSEDESDSDSYHTADESHSVGGEEEQQHKQDRSTLQMEVESREMIFRFNSLMYKLGQSLKNRNMVGDVISYLANLDSLPVYKAPEQRLFRDVVSKFLECRSIDRILIIIRPYMSFFSFTLAESITNDLGTDGDKGNMEKYKKELGEYAKRRISQSKLCTGSRDNSEKLTVKLDSTYNDCEGIHLLTFQENLTKILKLEQRALRLHEIKEGCFELVFDVPYFIPGYIFPLSADQKQSLEELGVLRVRCGDYQLTVKDESDDESSYSEFTDDPPNTNISLAVQNTTDTAQSERSVQSSIDGGNLSGSDEGHCSTLPPESLSLDLEYTQTFIMERFIASHPKMSAHSDSGVGKTRTWAPTIKSHVTEVDQYGADTTIIEEYSMDFGGQKLISEEPPPLANLASSKLHSAVFNGDLVKVRLLVEVLQCSPLAVNREGNTALHTAAACGNLDMLRYFVEDRLVNPAVESINGESCLHIAAHNGHLHVVQYLVGTQQVDPIILDKWKHSPIHEACRGGQTEIVKILIQESQKYQPFDMNENTATGHSYLHLAAEGGSPDLIEYFLSPDGGTLNVQSRTNSGHTALMLASRYGHLDVVKLLLLKGASANHQNKTGFTALHVASQEGHCGVVRKLLEGKADVNIKNNGGFTTLHQACDRGHFEVTEILVSANANINTQAKSGETALLRASFRGHLECVELLIEAGASVDVQNEYGHTAIHVASQEGHCGVVRKLLEARADVEIKTNDGFTALHLACDNGHFEVAEILVSANANINAQTKSGEFPLYKASFGGHLECVELLTEAGASVDVQKEDGGTALHVASQEGHCGVVRKLLEARADVNIKDNDGSTALHLACDNGHFEVAEILVSANANINVQTKFNVTPLLFAAAHCRVSIAQLLISNGADPNLKDFNGLTAYDWARWKGHNQVCALLASVNTKTAHN